MHEGLDELFEREFDAMVALARLMLGPGPDADDVVMTAFLSTAARIDAVVAPGAYLRTSVVNGCRRRLRDLGRQRRLFLERVAPAAAAASPPPAVEYLDDLLDMLSDRERAAIVLTYYLDLTTAQAAEVIGCRQGTVKSLVSRALAKMRKATGE
ncbi:MAG: RNA polymerase sigma factor [Ilumatobacter sp.]